MPRTLRWLAATLLLLPLAAAGCGTDDDARAGDAGLRVAAAFHPLAEAAAEVAGGRAEVTNLTPPGATPHDLELPPQRAAAIEDADLVVYLGGGFQPAVERAAAQLPERTTLDLLADLDLRPADAAIPGVRGEVDGETTRAGEDPHVWLDPQLFASLVERIERAFIELDPGGADAYRRNGAAYRAELRSLDRDFARALARCKTRTLVTSHAAFGYLADRYGLEQAPIAGISPEDDPDPRSLAATARRAEADGVTTVFFESLVPRRLSRVVADEIGARTAALDPVEGIPRSRLEDGASYLSIQRQNLAALAEGLGCTE